MATINEESRRGSGPTEQEKNAIEAMKENYREGDIAGIYTYINMDATDEEESPSGMLTIFPESAVVNPDSIKEQMFQWTGITKILPNKTSPSGYTDDDFVGKESAFDTALPQYTQHQGPSLENREKIGNRWTDRTAWAPELGEEGSLVGVYSATRDNGRGNDYYLVVRAGANKACRQLKDHLLQNKMTFGELIRNQKFHDTKNLAKRNAYRLLYNAANALGVKVAGLKDPTSVPEGVAHPFRAEPEYMQRCSTIERMDHDGRDCVGIYSNVVPMEDVNSSYDGNVFIFAHPYEGIYMYPFNNKGRGKALPVDTGRTGNYSGEDGPYNGFVNGKDHPELREGTFYPVNHDFEDSLVAAGWDRRHRRKHLVPVVVKMSDPRKKR